VFEIGFRAEVKSRFVNSPFWKRLISCHFEGSAPGIRAAAQRAAPGCTSKPRVAAGSTARRASISYRKAIATNRRTLT
jgi:hypothetical protein